MLQVALAIVLRDDMTLLARRPPGGHLEGLWEFPGGKIEPGEQPSAAALRELHEETGLAGGTAEKLTCVTHAYETGPVELHVYLVTGTRGTPVHHAGAEMRWVAPADLDPAGMPPANQAVVRTLCRHLNVQGKGF